MTQMATKPRYFAILGAMRTGSNLLERTLGQLQDTICYGEAFNPSFVSGPRKTEVLGYTVAKRDADPIGFLEHLISAEPTRIAGFRIFQNHSPEAMDYVLSDPRCIRIILTRDPLDSYISLKIAQRTDQWMLNNPRRRTTVRVQFDKAAFETFCQKREAHFTWLDQRLKAHGQDAIRIDYADLENHALLQRLASRIGSSGVVPVEPPIMRQNPVSRAAKVENYAEMCAVLGLDAETAKDDATPFWGSIIRPDQFGVAYAPIMGNAFEPMIALLHRIENRDFDRPKIAAPDLFDRAQRGVLYPEDTQLDVPVITMVSDPFRRLHAAFVSEVFGPGWNFSKLRKALIQHHGEMPPPRRLIQQQAEYPAQMHRRHFTGFLEHVAETFGSGEEGLLRPEWKPQSDAIEAHREQREITIFKHEDFTDAANWLTDLMKLRRFPRGQINGMRQARQQALVPIQEVAIPELTSTVKALHSVDYDQFGYQKFSDDA